MLITEQAHNLIIYLVIFTVLEQTLPLRKGQALLMRAGVLTDLAHYFITQGIAIWVNAQFWQVLTRALNQPGSVAESQPDRGLMAGWPFWLQLGVMLLSNDLVAYFYHRASHTISWLWKLHAIHHSSEELYWLAAIRFHPLDVILSRGLKYLPLALMGFSFEPFALALFFDGLHGYFIHANLRLRFGPVVSRFIVTPQFHHWHHSQEVIDKNFGGLIPWLDLLFGTYYLPGQSWPNNYGTDEPVAKRYLGQLLHPFVKTRAKESSASFEEGTLEVEQEVLKR
jgi:sterol desaturase/sphingolipid hydroxylase (fatty acid hydroxylase superfamily)